LRLNGLFFRIRGTPQIEVTFDIDANGIVHVSAKDKGTGRDHSITIQSSGGLSQAEIDKMVKEAEAQRENDEKKRQAIDIKNELDSQLYNIEKSFLEHRAKLQPADADEVQESINNAKSVQGSDDVEILRSALERLKTSAMKVGQAVYANTNAQKSEEATPPPEEPNQGESGNKKQ
jgi:molecular chaperone DnaK